MTRSRKAAGAAAAAPRTAIDTGTKVRFVHHAGAKPLPAEVLAGGDSFGVAELSVAATAEDCKALGLSPKRLKGGRLLLVAVYGPSSDPDWFPRWEMPS